MKLRNNPSSVFYLTNKFDNYESSCLAETSKLVQIQKLKTNTDNKTPRGLVDLMTEAKSDELLQLFLTSL